MLTPYLLWIKIGIVTLVVGLLLGAGIWFRGVLSDRDKFQKERDTAVQTVTDVMAARNAEKKLQGELTNAIKSIRVVSNNYIQSVEGAPAPAVGDGVVLTLIAGGVPEAVSRLPIFANNTASRAGTAAEAR